ncbi:hypothetical protein BS78_01G237700 [Paspalum vaginatum]|nr:hypothetical protein BS78_01G237700 [Paspalum vaginatum]
MHSCPKQWAKWLSLAEFWYNTCYHSTLQASPFKLVKFHLHMAQQRMKQQADKKRSERTFKVGDMVFLKLQPYIQSSVAARSNYKLYLGPYPVLRQINPVAYEVQLHPVASTMFSMFPSSNRRWRHRFRSVLNYLISILQIKCHCRFLSSSLSSRW